MPWSLKQAIADVPIKQEFLWLQPRRPEQRIGYVGDGSNRVVWAGGPTQIGPPNGYLEYAPPGNPFTGESSFWIRFHYKGDESKMTNLILSACEHGAVFRVHGYVDENEKIVLYDATTRDECRWWDVILILLPEAGV